jgi:hypothetical protein
MNAEKPVTIEFPISMYQPEWLLSTIRAYIDKRQSDNPEESDMYKTIPIGEILAYIIFEKGFGLTDDSDLNDQLINITNQNISMVFKDVTLIKDLFDQLKEELIRLACNRDIIIFMHVLQEDQATLTTNGEYELVCINTLDRLQYQEELAMILHDILDRSSIKYIQISYNKVS